jgi:DivIVA domain-containing protein
MTQTMRCGHGSWRWSPTEVPDGGDRVALTPDEIEGREFRVVDQGYDMVQVDTFLTEVAASYRYAVHNLLPGASGVGVGPATERHPSASSPDALSRVGQEVSEILRSAEKIAETVRGEADTDAATIRARADLESAELRQAADRDREQAKRLLTHAQEQADAIVGEAEEQARALLEQTTNDATERSEELLGRSRRHAEQILRAERAVVERLHEVRADVDSAIDRLAGSDERPVLDLTSGEPVLRVGGLLPSQPDDAEPTNETVDDPLRTMIRAAVDRAADEGASGTAEGDDDSNGATADSSSRRAG